MEKLYKIGIVAKTLNVHKATLHRWEREGKIAPSIRNKINNNRMYTEKMVEDIKKIMYDKA